jgi:hypothetical protein
MGRLVLLVAGRAVLSSASRVGDAIISYASSSSLLSLDQMLHPHHLVHVIVAAAIVHRHARTSATTVYLDVCGTTVVVTLLGMNC